MSNVTCPHCDNEFEYDGDTEGFHQDSEQVFECPNPKCEQEFIATVYWDLVIIDEKIK